MSKGTSHDIPPPSTTTKQKLKKNFLHSSVLPLLKLLLSLAVSLSFSQYHEEEIKIGLKMAVHSEMRMNLADWGPIIIHWIRLVADGRSAARSALNGIAVCHQLSLFWLPIRRDIHPPVRPSAPPPFPPSRLCLRHILAGLIEMELSSALSRRPPSTVHPGTSAS